ncbi:hypothetical protein HQO24_19995 [Rhodococcus fascians]|nr:hypothetical protein [Rhodococcus fascians]MBY4398765.1 hypothetical protein [Rhodococcus fascians]MBY4408131.1 hypothetical protein [Rhodococcus fascians]MBY4423354.1 hypothetical protein [Rhodococcus fascians]MBY4461122.1 hypothetical protein [Rhodococcus fascians]
MTHDAICLPDATAYIAGLLAEGRRLSDVVMIAAHTFEVQEAAEDLAMSCGDMLATYGLHIVAAYVATLALLLDPHVMF